MTHRYYHLCRANIGRIAYIRTRDGRRITGRVDRVTPTHVYITPFGHGVSLEQKVEEGTPDAKHAITTTSKEKGEEVLFFFFPVAIAFAAIAAIAFAAAFSPFVGFRRPFFRRPFFPRRPFVRRDFF
ncbi:hypothetical protein CathTA2_1741 [Caldalkalibacillus thermarum TA2.A1]|uniref:Uncharacterized protein n=1 Tax=Caldalkalibacillus thermarum (strain TA2.A1) TaxID=986075 RepID=F5L7E1_CALTT|nr:hypothetical protein [Caldalkalibacillus thermarum]EGL82733.1 hypothetical protein CathTA2_1741 [Caldalkalibacillus thermarum TA2.A1]QZT32568.1 hypothetical protein HUR95_09125 [Caldalkalibacillus thermarum TA2.A1]